MVGSDASLREEEDSTVVQMLEFSRTPQSFGRSLMEHPMLPLVSEGTDSYSQQCYRQ